MNNNLLKKRKRQSPRTRIAHSLFIYFIKYELLIHYYLYFNIKLYYLFIIFLYLSECIHLGELVNTLTELQTKHEEENSSIFGIYRASKH